MVQELRRIILDNEEVILALDAYHQITPNFLPAGSVKDFKIVDKHEITVTLAAAGDGKEINAKLTALLLLQPLIRFCLENNIMLPREGVKSVLILNDRISLSINLGQVNVDKF